MSIFKKIFTTAFLTLVFSAFIATTAFANTVEDAPDAEQAEHQQFITTANLNLRTGPSTDYDRITLLNSGTVITVTEFDADGFSEVIANGVHGFVSSEWIRPHVPSSAPIMQSTAPAPAQVSINGTVELLPWSEVKQILPRNTDIHVLDVRTGHTYFVRNWSNGNHADVDPLTAQDAETLRATFGGRWSWDPRPVIVTFNGRSFAAAINGMPHGGSQIANNGVSGHFCLHFLGSTTHNGNRSYEREMQAAVMQAFNSAN